MDDSNSKNKKSGKRLSKLSIVIIICSVLILISIVLLIFISKQEKAVQGADQAIRLSTQGGFSCEYAEAQKLYPFEDGVIKVTNNRIAYLTLAGNEVYSSSIDYSNPYCFVDNDMAIVIDVDGYSFTLLDKDDVLYTKPTSNKIKTATISSNGMVAIITDGEDSYGEVIIYDYTGAQVSSWKSYNSGYPLYCIFNDDSSQLAVSTVNTNGATYKPYIRIFALNDKDDNLFVTDYAMYSIDDSDIISYMTFCGNDLFAFSASNIYQIVDDKLEAIGSDFGSLVQVSNVGSNIFMVYADGVNQVNKLAVISSSGKTIYNSAIGSNLHTVNTDGSKYAISIDDKIYVYNRSGDVIADISVDEELLRIGFIGNDKLVVVSTGGVHTINY